MSATAIVTAFGRNIIEVDYYDANTFAYLGGNVSGPSIASVDNLIVESNVPPATVACCGTGAVLYRTNSIQSGPLNHDIAIAVVADTADTVQVDLVDSAASGTDRSYRMDAANTLTPLAEVIYVEDNSVASLFGGTGSFAMTFHLKY